IPTLSSLGRSVASSHHCGGEGIEELSTEYMSCSLIRELAELQEELEENPATFSSPSSACSAMLIYVLRAGSNVAVLPVNKHKPWIETSYHGVITENMDTVLLDPPLVALDKDAPVPFADGFLLGFECRMFSSAVKISMGSIEMGQDIKEGSAHQSLLSSGGTEIQTEICSHPAKSSPSIFFPSTVAWPLCARSDSPLMKHNAKVKSKGFVYNWQVIPGGPQTQHVNITT
ncbi:hypothetical protein DNTS_026151, partial [Danionella cerebrum]